MDPRSARGSGLSFGRVAQLYERSRPGYPEAALDWLLPPGARRVADVGAGTGKLSRLLVARGLEVTAVEPDDGMRAELARRVPEALALAGRGEAIPLPDGAVDAVLFAQAWHWVDARTASAEVARVLVPGGRLGLLWNMRDRSTGWVRDLEELMVAAGASAGYGWSPQLAVPLQDVQRHEVSWVHELPGDLVADMVASRSYVIDMQPAEREALLAQVRDLVSTHPQLRGQDVIEVPYLTHCFRSTAPR